MTTSASRPRCDRCRFWVLWHERAEPDHQEGECRRRAPSPVTLLHGDAVADWPLTLAKSWCGEHEAVVEVSP